MRDKIPKAGALGIFKFAYLNIIVYNETMKIQKIIKKIKTKMGIFNCLFESNSPEKGYTVTVPKLKGVVTFGDNLKEAENNAKEAIELHCECLLENGLAEVRPIFGGSARELAKV